MSLISKQINKLKINQFALALSILYVLFMSKDLNLKFTIYLFIALYLPKLRLFKMTILICTFLVFIRISQTLIPSGYFVYSILDPWIGILSNLIVFYFIVSEILGVALFRERFLHVSMRNKYFPWLHIFSSYTLIFIAKSHENRIYEVMRSGYDNISHFAMLNANAECGNFLAKCSYAIENLPTGFLYYPNTWHVFFQQIISFRNLSRFDYSVLVFLSSIIAAKLILGLKNEIDNVFKDGRKTAKISIKTLTCQSILAFLLATLFLSGYHNFIFSISLISYSVFIVEKKDLRIQDVCMAVAGLWVAVSSYTLFWPLCLFFTIIFVSQSAKSYKYNLLIKSALILVSLVLSWSVFKVQIEQNHVGALQEKSSGWTLMIPMVLVTSLISFRELKKHPVYLGWQILVASNLCLMGLQLLIFASGNIGSYFVFKFGFLNLVLFLMFGLKSPTELSEKRSERKKGRRAKHQRKAFHSLDRQITLTRLTFGFVIFVLVLLISIIGSGLKLNPLPNPTTAMSIFYNAEDARYVEKAIEFVNTKRLSKFIVSTPDFAYYSDTQYVASVTGNWSPAIQSTLDAFAKDGVMTLDEYQKDTLRAKGFTVISFNQNMELEDVVVEIIP